MAGVHNFTERCPQARVMGYYISKRERQLPG